MIKDYQSKKFASQFEETIKEKSIRTHYNNSENFLKKYSESKAYLYFDPPEIILQNIETKKLYEIPVRVHNISSRSKRILIKGPFTNAFRIESVKLENVKKKKENSYNFQISPGLFYEMLIFFETNESENFFDHIDVYSENLKITLPLKAYKAQPVVIFEPFINLGFVPVNAKKIEKICFINEGVEPANIELRFADKSITDVQIINEKFSLNEISTKTKPVKAFDLYNNQNQSTEKSIAPKNTSESFLIYIPDQSKSFNYKLEVINTIDNSLFGVIEVVGTSVEQQISVVFDDGGGPATEIKFGTIYFGQKKERSAFIVNNGPYEMNFRMFFHVDKEYKGNNNELNDSDFACTPEEAGKEMTQRVLGCNIKEGILKPFQQLPIKFQANSKIFDKATGWRGHFSDLTETNTTFQGNAEDKLKIHTSTAAIKFSPVSETNSKLAEFNFDTASEICKTISVYMELTTVIPEVTFDKTMINFWNCKIGESHSSFLRITNKHSILPIDFSINKIPYFHVKPDVGVIGASEHMDLLFTFNPKNPGNYNNLFCFKYVSGLYKMEIKVIGKAVVESFFDQLMSETMKENKFRETYKSNEFLKTEYNSTTNLNFKQTQSEYLEATKTNFHQTLVSNDPFHNMTTGSGSPFKLSWISDKTEGYIKSLGNLLYKNCQKDTAETLLDRFYIYLRHAHKENEKKKKKNENKDGSKRGPKPILGPEATDTNFKTEPHEINKELAMNYTLPSLKKAPNATEKTEKMYLTRLAELICNNSNQVIIEKMYEDFEKYIKTQKNKIKYNDTLSDFRRDRIETKKLEHQRSDTTSQGHSTKYSSKFDFERGPRMESPKFSIPKFNEGLWVTRPIGKYEPQDKEDNSQVRPEFNPNQKPERVPDTYPRTPIDLQDCNTPLDGHKLQCINVGPSKISFDKVFKGSEESRTFWVRNNLRTAIFVEFIIGENQQEIKNIIPKSMVVGAGQTEGTIIVFQSFAIGNNGEKTLNLKYKINYNYHFKLKLVANVVPASFHTEQTEFRFSFQSSQTPEMVSVKEATLTNNGNSKIKFRFKPGLTGHFKVNPEHGEIGSKGKIDVQFSFDPLEVDNKNQISDSMICDIENGETITFKMIGYIISSKVVFMEPEFGVINFKDIHVGKKDIRFFRIFNEKYVTTAYQIGEHSKYLTFKEMRDVVDQRPKTIEVNLSCNDKIENYKETVKIYIRGGGKPLELKIMANIIEPQVSLNKNFIKFPKAWNGEEVNEEISFRNISNLSAFVEVDLNDPQFANFRMELSPKYIDSSHFFLKNLDSSFSEDNQDNSRDDMNLGAMNEDDGAPDDDENAGSKQNSPSQPKSKLFQEEPKSKSLRHFEIEIKPASSLDFILFFKPMGSEIPENQQELVRNLNLQFKLIGIGETEGLKTMIETTEVRSRITLDTEFKFEKTFLNSVTDNHLICNDKHFKIFNSDYKKLIKFQLDVSRLDPAFKVEPLQGNILPGDDYTTLKISFRPERVFEYKSTMVVKLLNDQTGEYEKAKEVTLYGEGAKPRIYFDKREIIMPVVPLGIESKATVKIINEGYGLMMLDCKAKGYQGANLDFIKINWLNGSEISAVREELRLEISFASKPDKPLYFSGRLEISDRMDEIFNINIYGISDNSIMTNYPFYQHSSLSSRPYVLKEDDNTNGLGSTVNLVPLQFTAKGNSSFKLAKVDDDSDTPKETIDATSTQKPIVEGQQYTKEYKALLLKNCKYLSLYLNKILSHSSNNSFPEGISNINNRGDTLLNMIENLSGLTPQIQFDKYDENPNVKVKQLRKFFLDIIRFLQENGAQLNTVIPEYLLDVNSYKKYVKQDDYTRRTLPPNWEKITKVMYYYKFIHLESWIHLIYQIVKIFYASRVNMSSFRKSLRYIPSEDTKNSIIQGMKISGVSNFYSLSEIILLRWLKITSQAFVTTEIKNLNNFTENLADGSIIYGCVSTYLPYLEEQSKQKKRGAEKDTRYSSIIDKTLFLLKDYGVFSHVETKNFNSLDDREMLIFIIILFQSLPHFIPREVIEFSCILNDSVSKVITINHNSSNKKKIEYGIKKFGNLDFTIPKETQIIVSPNEPYNFRVSFKSRFSGQVEGILYFVNKCEGLAYQAIPLVYKLFSNVTERRSLGSTLLVRTPLYKKINYSMFIKSPFQTKGEFTVCKPEIKKKTNSSNYRKRVTLNNQNSLTNINNKRQDKNSVPPVFFFVHKDRKYPLDPNDNSGKEVVICFCPIDTDVYECNLVFICKDVGEFQVTLEGCAEMPEIFEVLNFEAEVNEQKEFNIDVKLMNRSLKSAIELLSAQYENKEEAKLMLIPPVEKVTYSVECTKPQNYNFSNQFILDPLLLEAKALDAISGIIPLRFQCKSVMTVEADLIFKSQERNNDVRVYKLIVKVKPKNIYALLKFNCPVGQEICQRLNFQNKNQFDCILSAQLLSMGPRNYFTVDPLEKKLQKASSDVISLKFFPKEKIDVNATLKIRNDQTFEIYEYKLEGKVDDPLAEGMINIHCSARSNYTHRIIFDEKLSTYGKDDGEIIYKVETDLGDIVSGDGKFVYRPKLGQTFYEFTVKPLLGKNYFGKITFYPENLKTYKWYTINIKSDSILENNIVNLSTTIRKTIFIDINIDNPTNENTIFDVEILGNYLKGDPYIHVDAGKTAIYRLVFSPLKVFELEGRLRISNEKIGEHIYKLMLSSIESKPIYVDTLIAELGKHTDYHLVLDNPSDSEVAVVCKRSNPNQFQTFPTIITIPEGTSKEIIVRYTPSQLEHPEDCTIRFVTDEIGIWEYFFKGKGVLPDQMPKTIVSSYVGGSVSGIVVFRNPFNSVIQISIDLKTDTPNVFRLVTHKGAKKTLKISNLGLEQISFGFFPQKLVKYTAEMIVTSITHNLVWTFPIEGITEVKSKGLEHTFSVKSKQLLDTKITLDLTAVPDEIELKDLMIEQRAKEEKYKFLLEKCLNLSLDSIPLKTEGNPNYVLLNIKFYPLRPFKSECEIIIIKKSGGQWIYNMIFEATEPDPEDVIKIQSTIGKPSSVSFRLQNIFSKNAKFVAYFTHDSSSEFNIKPKDGILDQSMKEGTLFIITYLPVEYGKIKIGKLIIESDEIQWIYHVHGTHLEYVLPEIKPKLMNPTMSSMIREQQVLTDKHANFNQTTAASMHQSIAHYSQTDMNNNVSFGQVAPFPKNNLATFYKANNPNLTSRANKNIYLETDYNISTKKEKFNQKPNTRSMSNKQK